MAVHVPCLLFSSLLFPVQVTVDVRIPALLIKIQHEELERMGVRKEDGQEALNRYTKLVTAVNDEAAHQRVDDFTHT